MSYLDQRKKPRYYLGCIIKATMLFKIDNYETFYLIPGNYNSNYSFKLLANGEKYDMDDIFINRIRPSSRLFLRAFSRLPSKAINIIIDLFAKMAGAGKLTNDIQKVPQHLFQNLSTIKLGNLLVSCPRNYTKYLELVYGKSWRIRNPDWKREQMGIKEKPGT